MGKCADNYGIQFMAINIIASMVYPMPSLRWENCVSRHHSQLIIGRVCAIVLKLRLNVYNTAIIPKALRVRKIVYI